MTHQSGYTQGNVKNLGILKKSGLEIGLEIGVSYEIFNPILRSDFFKIPRFWTFPCVYPDWCVV